MLIILFPCTLVLFNLVSCYRYILLDLCVHVVFDYVAKKFRILGIGWQ
jgi:hypothetical protein